MSQLEQEYSQPFGQWKAAPGPKTAGGLLKAVDPVLKSGVNAYSQGSPSPSLKSRAKKIALNAFNTYDPNQGKLKTHLMSHLQGLRRYAQQQQSVFNVPEQVRLDAFHLSEAENRLRDNLGRDPSDLELADETGLSRKRLAYVRQVPMAMHEGRFAEMGEAGQGYSPGVANTSPAADNAWADFVYHDLSEIDQNIMEYTLGMNGNPQLPTGEIAQKLGISASAVSQRASKIQQLLNQRDDMELF